MSLYRLKVIKIVLINILLVYSFPMAHAEFIKNTSKRQDNSTIYWSLEFPAHNDPRGLLLIAQGSGCLPAIKNKTVQQVKTIAPSFAVLLVEKYGVTHADGPNDQFKDCSQAYVANHTVEQRTRDVVQIVDELKDSNWWNGKLVLFGGSEGGDVVARLASRLNPDAAVVFSSGLGQSFAEVLKSLVPPHVAKEVDAKLAYARANPESVEVWGGNSMRWWADVVDRIPVNDLMDSHAPVLLIQGTEDKSSPVSSGRAARDAYASAGRCELTYWEYPGYDHYMTDTNAVNHRGEVFERIAGWIKKTVIDGAPGCMSDTKKIEINQ
ncbi:alpha/beta hydrolase family protein [Microbulbifer sp. CnH-101-G]|uniref:alpha/beta hydrolase family protein n=1 Tax=Microbulbifer sp. CnH-101-G TaxID=3243393 RepID=UPI0040391236